MKITKKNLKYFNMEQRLNIEKPVEKTVDNMLMKIQANF